MTTHTIPANTRPDRPLGVWILSLYAALILGFQTAVYNLLDFSWGSSLPTEPAILVWLAVIAFFLGIGVLIAAIGTWQGKPAFRNALIVQVILISLVNLTSTLLYFLMWVAFSSPAPEMISSAQISITINIAGYLIVVAIFVVYFLRRREFFQPGQDSQPEGFLTSLDAVPESRSYFLLAGSLVVFLHWFVVFPSGGLSGLNIFLTMPDALIDSLLIAFFYPQPFAVFIETGPIVIIQKVISPILSAVFWFALGIGLAYKIKPLKRVLAVCLGIKIVLLLLGLMMVI